MSYPRSTVIGGDLITGLVRIRNIPARSASVTQDLGAGSVEASVKLPLIDPASPGAPIDLPNVLVPGKSFLGFVQGTKIVEAGPIWTDEDDLDTGMHTMRALGLRSIFQYRYVLGLLAGGELPQDKLASFTGVSLRTQAKRLVQLTQEWTPTLPIVLEADFAGTSERNYPGVELMRMSDALDNLENVLGGPDIAFRPRFVAGGTSHVEWVMTTGDPYLTQGAGARHVWDTSVIGSTVKGTKIKRDATMLVTDSFQQGQQVPAETPDLEPVQLEAVASDTTITAAGFPRMQAADARYSVTEVATLQDYADEAVLVGQFSEETWELRARKNSTPKLEDYNAGDLAVVVLGTNQHRKPAGRYPVRIMSIEADRGPWVTIKFAPERV